jgi:hypothetical protein
MLAPWLNRFSSGLTSKTRPAGNFTDEAAGPTGLEDLQISRRAIKSFLRF